MISTKVALFLAVICVVGTRAEEDGWIESITNNLMTAKEFMKNINEEALKKYENAREFFTDKVKNVEDVTSAESNAELDKKVVATESFLIGLKERKEEILKREDITQKQKDALNKIDENLKAVQDAKQTMAESTDLEMRRSKWESTMKEMYEEGELKEYIAIAGASAVAASIALILAALALLYAK